MKKRFLSILLSLCMVLALFPATAFAEDNEEPTETPVCTCEAACAAEAMNADCPICGAEGATAENCGKYEAPIEETEPEQTAIEKVQALIDALPDADTITEENRADVEAQLTAIDEAKFPLSDELDALDFSKYNDAIAALNELDGMGGAEVPTVAEGETTWTNGDQVYTLNNGVLTITGTGGISEEWKDALWSSGAYDVTSVVICDGIEGIGELAFYALDNLTSVTIPDSVTTIGSSAFVQCEVLADINIPDSVTSIEESAFYGCMNLKTIAIPYGVTSIERDTFLGCYELESVSIPSSVTTIKDAAFFNCYKLSSITLPNSITTIEGCAFGSCISLTSVTIPNSVTSLSERAFLGCDKLTRIDVDDGNEVYSSIDGAVFSKDKSKAVIIPSGISGEYIIPSDVTIIGKYAFSGNRKLTNVVIPNGVTAIEDDAFSYCKGLTGITIPDSVKTIGKYAFNACEFRNITIPNGVISISDHAFDDSDLVNIIMSNSVESIGNEIAVGCYNLANVYYLGTNAQWNELAATIPTGNDRFVNCVRRVPVTYTVADTFVYDGNQKTGATVSKFDDDLGDITIKYYQDANEVLPINAGTYTVKLDVAESAEYEAVIGFEIGTFTILKANQSVPTGLVGTAETIDGKADGKINGVTTAMEYRKEGDTDYTAITGTEITGLADGKYYVRYKADDNHNASTDAEVTIAVGRKLTVTVPTTQVGYTLLVNKTELVWKDSVELTFALVNGYSKLDTFAVNVNGNPVTLDANGKYTVTDVQSDITITVAGVAKDVTAPTISGIENGKTYCKEQTVTVTDDNGIASVTVNGTPVTLDADGKFTLSPAKGTQTVVATDKAGNISAEMIVTVNDGHEGGTATCKDKAVCDYCGEPYGEIDSRNHAVTEVRNAKNATCTEDGYTGDTYCKGCDTKLSSGKSVDKTGHDYESKVTKEATTTSTGTKTYTCKNCEHSYEEEIAKLPSQSTSPQTGDNSNMALWFALILLSGGALAGTAVYGKKRKHSAK